MRFVMEMQISRNLLRSHATLRPLPHSLISPQEEGPLSYLVDTPTALRILLSHKLRDSRFQQLLARWACILLSVGAIGLCGFLLAPTFWFLSAFAPAIFLVALFLSIEAGDLFVRFALEDERFFELATKNHALSVFTEDDQSLPQPPE